MQTICQYFDGLVWKRRNSSALAMELRLSCTNPLIYSPQQNAVASTTNLVKFILLFLQRFYNHTLGLSHIMKAKAMGLDESEDSEDEESEDDNKTVSQKSDHRDLSPYKSQSRKYSGSYPAKVLRLRAFFFENTVHMTCLQQSNVHVNFRDEYFNSVPHYKVYKCVSGTHFWSLSWHSSTNTESVYMNRCFSINLYPCICVFLFFRKWQTAILL